MEENSHTDPEDVEWGVAGLGDGRRADEPTPFGRGRVDGVLDLDIMSWLGSMTDNVPPTTCRSRRFHRLLNQESFFCKALE